MNRAKSLLLASVAIAIVGGPQAFAAPQDFRPILLAQAGDQVAEAIAAAEAKVEAARAVLEAAIAKNEGVEEAKQALNEALKQLADAQAAAAAAPPPAEVAPPPAAEAPPPAEQPAPPADQAQPPAAEAPPPAEQPAPPAAEAPKRKPKPPTAGVAPPPPPQPAPAEQPAPPADQAQPPAAVEPPAAEQPAPPAAVAPPPAAVEPAPVTQPAVETPPPPLPVEKIRPPKGKFKPPAGDQVAPPAVDTPVTPQDQQTLPADQSPAPPSAEQQPPATTQPPAVEPVVKLPPPVVDAPPPPPPPAATEGAFDLQKFKNRPKFGEAPPPAAATTAKAPPVALPQSEGAVREGAVLAAPDGRVIVKEGGQVSVRHDDSGRFVRQGDRFQTAPSDNNTETTTVSRPDGTEIVTVRDQNGNIIQRYRRNQNGSVDVFIGEVENPSFIGRMFGRGPRPAEPRPHPRPVLNLQLGPVQIDIPRQDYIVESSRASEQQLQTTLMAPPVEQVERPYSLEEIRRSERIREKVRRIDFDTVTFEFGSAVLPDDQIPQMQAVGEAIKGVLQRNPDQVFLIEGHTDAVGSDLANLALSDRRAETVAEILTYYFGVPAENLVSQGYGEQYLKVPTNGPERQNRRVAFRNITSLMRVGNR